MEFPLAKRELTQAGRDRRTYILRTVLAGGAVVILWLTWSIRSFTIMAVGSGAGLTGGAEVMGQSLAATAQGIQLLATFLVAPILSAGLICTERQEGTLGLLLMADLSGRDVFLAKFLRAFVFTELLLVSMLPFAAFASLLGGVSVPDVAAGLLILSFYSAAICALGLLFSAVSRRPATAFFLTMLATFTWVYLAREADMRLLPVLGMDGIRLSVLALFEDYLRFDDIAGTLIPQAIVAIVVGGTAAALTIRLLPRLVAPPAASRRKPTKARNGFWRRPPFFNAAERIVASGSPSFIAGLRPWPLRIPVFLFLVVLSAIPSCGPLLFIRPLMFYDILSSLHAARRDGSLDELVLTPLPDYALATALFRASLRIALFYGAAGAVAAVGMEILRNYGASSFAFSSATSPYATPFTTFGSVADVFAAIVGIMSIIMTALVPLASAACGASIAAFIGVQRGNAAGQTAIAMGIQVFISGVLALGYYFFWIIAGTANRFPYFNALFFVEFLTGLFYVFAYSLAAFILYLMLRGSVRVYLGTQSDIYVPTVLHATARETE